MKHSLKLDISNVLIKLTKVWIASNYNNYTTSWREQIGRHLQVTYLLIQNLIIN